MVSCHCTLSDDENHSPRPPLMYRVYSLAMGGITLSSYPAFLLPSLFSPPYSPLHLSLTLLSRHRLIHVSTMCTPPAYPGLCLPLLPANPHLLLLAVPHPYLTYAPLVLRRHAPPMPRPCPTYAPPVPRLAGRAHQYADICPKSS